MNRDPDKEKRLRRRIKEGRIWFIQIVAQTFDNKRREGVEVREGSRGDGNEWTKMHITKFHLRTYVCR